MAARATRAAARGTAATNAQLQAAIAGATRMQLREWRGDVIEVTDAAAVADLASHLEVVGSEDSFAHCMCVSSFCFVFLRDDGVVAAEMSIQHGTQLRWPAAWAGDAPLTPDSSAFVTTWLAARGMPGPKQEVDEARARAEREARRSAMAEAAMPAALRPAFDRGNVDAFVAAVGSPGGPTAVEAATAALRVFGIANEDWSSLDERNRRVVAVLKRLPKDVVTAAVEASLVGSDRLARRGAARAWLGSWEVVAGWSPGGDAAGAMYGAALAVMREARCGVLRQMCVRLLPSWHGKGALPPATIERVLLDSMADPDDNVRRLAMLVAPRLHMEAAIVMLQRVALGETVAPVPLAPVPAEEEDLDGRPGGDKVAAGRPLTEVAALALGYASCEAARPMLRVAADGGCDMCSVSLALMGEEERLRPHHFATADDNQALQLAAVEAVVRCRGRMGLPLVVKYEQVSHWWELGRVQRDVVEMLRLTGAPAVESLSVGPDERLRDLNRLGEWVAVHGLAHAAWQRRRVAMFGWCVWVSGGGGGGSSMGE